MLLRICVCDANIVSFGVRLCHYSLSVPCPVLLITAMVVHHCTHFYYFFLITESHCVQLGSPIGINLFDVSIVDHWGAVLCCDVLRCVLRWVGLGSLVPSIINHHHCMSIIVLDSIATVLLEFVVTD